MSANLIKAPTEDADLWWRILFKMASAAWRHGRMLRWAEEERNKP